VRGHRDVKIIVRIRAVDAQRTDDSHWYLRESNEVFYVAGQFFRREINSIPGKASDLDSLTFQQFPPAFHRFPRELGAAGDPRFERIR
jgi:hypothetical protein